MRSNRNSNLSRNPQIWFQHNDKPSLGLCGGTRIEESKRAEDASSRIAVAECTLNRSKALLVDHSESD